jgi:hypothetical protein
MRTVGTLSAAASARAMALVVLLTPPLSNAAVMTSAMALVS